jgi:hypothetical protein
MNGSRVFVSYSTRDKDAAFRICESLERQGAMCWIAPRDIKPGADWDASIVKAIDDALAMVLVFSQNAENSRQIKKELVLASNGGKLVIPARVENLLPTDASFRYQLSTPQWIDLFHNWETGIDQIVQSVRELVPTPVPPPPPTPPDGTKPAPADPPFFGHRPEVPRPGLVVTLPTSSSRNWKFASAISLLLMLAIAVGIWVHLRKPNEAVPADLRPPKAEADTKSKAGTDAMHPTDKATPNPGDLDNLVRNGTVYFNQGLYDLAIQASDQAIKLDLNDVRAYINRGNSLVGKGQYDRAIQDYDLVIKLAPAYAGAYQVRGEAYFHKGQYDRAIQDYDQSIKIEWRSDAFTYRGMAYLMLNELDAAIVDFDAQLRIAPNEAMALFSRGVAKRKKADKAGGDADIAAAKALKSDIAADAAKLGIRP